tara:strand:+ start:10872 stop:12005 length:1134 start_codon:yes stop_codon:yes gene_type:complete
MSTQNCSNCYNGCTEITSDKCVKYTGVDVPIMGIQNGDSLSYVEQALITFLGSALDGTGIHPVVQPSDICPVVQAHLDDCQPLSLNDYLTAIIRTICELNEEIANSGNQKSATAYNLECIGAVTDDTSTVEVLQQTIVKLCEVEQSLNTFITDVTTNYVQIVDINTYIENYLNTNPQQQLISNRMVPYSAQPYFGPLTPFDSNGAGIGDWDRIFLCNGQNGTPDLRGRVVVASTDMVGSSLSNVVDPAVAGNPAYDFGTVHGSNQVTLTTAQIPSHNHNNVATSIITPAAHTHHCVSLGNLDETNPVATNNFVQEGKSTGGNLGYALRGTSVSATVGLTDSVSLSCATDVDIQPFGGGLSHDNYQPSYASYYIIYIP